MQSMTRAIVACLAIAAGAACERRPVVTPPLTACPDGATLVGDGPPQGLRQRCERSEGERHGASREWYENKRDRSYSEWWNGEKHGRFTLWFPSGRVRSEGAHRHGVPAGRWRYFREDGTVQQDQTFAVEPPPADWLAQALAGHPPADPPPASPTGGRGERAARAAQDR
jgi:hypothetical protein